MTPQALGGAQQLLSGVLADDAVRAAYRTELKLTLIMTPQVLDGAEQLLSGVLADDAVRAAYLARTGQPVGELKAAAGLAKQKSLDSDACPICFDELTARERAINRSLLRKSCKQGTSVRGSPCVILGTGAILACWRTGCCLAVTAHLL